VLAGWLRISKAESLKGAVCRQHRGTGLGAGTPYARDSCAFVPSPEGVSADFGKRASVPRMIPLVVFPSPVE
jgi:hypothetical protein